MDAAAHTLHAKEATHYISTRRTAIYGSGNATTPLVEEPVSPSARLMENFYIVVTVNDVLIGITYSALSRYYFRKSGDTRLSHMEHGTRASVDMINSGREEEVKLGNALGFIILPFHVGMHKDPLDYVRKAKKVVDRKKSSLEVVFTNLVAEVVFKLFGLKVEFCGHPVVFIAPSVYGPPEAQFPDCHELLDDFAESLRHIKDAALTLGN
uniref:O-acyltransferase WSD1 C-terminal domain-containing protein n=1 Tax=Leersia perrieri TaxID=77586 RepID=A0A0D9XSH6_9ORYZ